MIAVVVAVFAAGIALVVWGARELSRIRREENARRWWTDAAVRRRQIDREIREGEVRL